MRIIKTFTDQEYLDMLKKFHSQFKTGFEFEDFLKPFLEKMGFEEVLVTQRTKDGGIDLTAKKTCFIPPYDDILYKIQAKRYDPVKTINPSKIAALRGNLKPNEKGIFITTGKITDQQKQLALTKDPSRPIVVWDGRALIDLLIDLEIGFSYKPIFSPSALNDFLNSSNTVATNATNNNSYNSTLSSQSVKKLVSSNDIRVKILSMPISINDKLNNNKTKRKLEVEVNGKTYHLNFNPERIFLSGVTDIFKSFGILCPDGTFVQKELTWDTDGEKIIISIP